MKKLLILLLLHPTTLLAPPKLRRTKAVIVPETITEGLILTSLADEETYKESHQYYKYDRINDRMRVDDIKFVNLFFSVVDALSQRRKTNTDELKEAQRLFDSQNVIGLLLFQRHIRPGWSEKS